MPSYSTQHSPAPGVVSKHDIGIYYKSQLQMKEFGRVASFINSHLCNHMHVRPDTVQSLKAGSTLSQKGQKDVASHSTSGIEITFFTAGCPAFQ